MAKNFQRITLYARPHTAGLESIISDLCLLLSQQGVELRCEQKTSTYLTQTDLPTVAFKDIGQNTDLIVVIGGDGSMLRAAKVAAPYKTPLIGINKGQLGFLADIYPNKISEQLSPVLQGHYQLDKRVLLHAYVNDDEHTIDCGCALNDVVLIDAEGPHLIDFEIYVDGHFVGLHQADGIIVATPTGSTAYSLSAGGPIIHPQTDALLLLPMFAHTLTSRPIVVPGESKIELKYLANNQRSALLNCNGSTRTPVAPGMIVSIHQHPDRVHLVHPPDYDYYDRLHRKLNWNNRPLELC